MIRAKPSPRRHERRIMGAEQACSFQPNERVQQVIELGRIARTIKGGRLEKLMAPQGETLDLEKMLGLLNRHEVEFLVVGGYAVAFHGHPRFTRDLELFYHQTPENAERLLAAFREYRFEIPLSITAPDLLHSKLNYKIGFPPSQLDLNPDVKGLNWPSASAQAVAGELLGQRVRFISFDALIESKRAAARPQDLADIDQLMRSLGEF